ATDPVFTATPADRNITLDRSCQLTVPDLAGEVTATDNCTAPGAIVITQSPVATTVIASGEGTTHTVTMTIDDGNGNTDTFDVTLTGDDATDPVFTATPADRNITLDGACQLTVPDLTGEVTATDNCTAPGAIVITQSPVATTVIASGEGTTHTITMTIDDGNGNTDTYDVTLTGDDATDPVFTATPADRNVTLNSSCQLTVPDLAGEVTATDNCTAPGAIVITQSPVATTVIASGEGTTHTVTMTIDDGNGNTDTYDVTLTGDDAEAPIVICPPDRNENVDPSLNFTIPDYTSLASSSDNCTATPTLSQDPVAGTVISGEGTVQPIKITADDGNGNTGECTFIVTLVNVPAPTIVCPPDQNENLDNNCQFILSDYTSLAIVTGASSVTQSPVPGTVISGASTVQPITLTAKNIVNDSVECTFNVI
ncbi:hypothetical protein LCGC14_2736840, partial [marine sediment metagenome]